MLHQGADAEPEAVQEGEVVLHHIGAGVTGMGVVPFVRAEPGKETASWEAFITVKMKQPTGALN